MAYFLLFLAATASAAATLLLRRAGTVSEQAEWLGIPAAYCLTALALAAYGVGFLAYAQSLKFLPANVAYPVMTGCTMLLAMAAAFVFLGEGIGVRTLIGAALIVGGVVLIGAR
ncbi:MAG TPA: SMR family transporter [Burkholderiaceae bacterium]|jgi:multidrug transporter EmrE-like cation transporter